MQMRMLGANSQTELGDPMGELAEGLEDSVFVELLREMEAKEERWK